MANTQQQVQSLAQNFCASHTDEDITDMMRVCLYYLLSRAECNSDEQDDQEQDIIEVCEQMDKGLDNLRALLSRRVTA